MTTLKILAADEALEEWASRDARGNLVTIEVGEPDADGFCTPFFTVHYDDNLVTRYRDVVEAARQSQPPCDHHVPLFVKGCAECADNTLTRALQALDSTNA